MTMDARLKLTLLLTADALVVLGCQTATLALLGQSYGSIFTPLTSLLAFISAALFTGFYKTNISHVGVSAAMHALGSTVASGVIIYLLNGSARLAIFSSSLVLVSILGYRVVARELLFQQRRSGGAKTLVYGAGSAGVQFAVASMQSDRHDVIGYIDDDTGLCGTSIHGRLVHPSKDTEELINDFSVTIVVLALPSITTADRKRIIDSLIRLPVRVVTVPTFEDLIEGRQQITQTEDVTIEDLLGRDPVPPIDSFMEARTTHKVCLVTGAGGSIGSELCRQIIKCQPKHLILVDISEPALFSIEQQLLLDYSIPISSYLGSVTDLDFLARLFKIQTINCVFHAAAYKHVPLVEANPLIGLINNVHGTQNILRTALSHNCESFTLISTDKAVRPTNVMGATKRLAEMACQLSAAENPSHTVISMVRFGNVLGSSGSVVPTFRQQIKRGGPVTLTHPDITRYFMTIPEAAQLVVQASGMARSGDLFLLDMGTPIKIYDLAERLIRLSGKSVKKAEADEKLGQINIEITGLRPGEKLYEELLVDATAQPTKHIKILRAREGCVDRETFDTGLEKLVATLEKNDIGEFKLLLTHLVNGYKPYQPETNDA